MNRNGWLFLAYIIIGLVLLIPVKSWGDTIHLYNGQTIEGKLKDVEGELIRFNTEYGLGNYYTRLNLASKRDLVKIFGKEEIIGQVIYVDTYKLEVQTDHGRVRIWKMFVRDVEMGTPLPANQSAALQNGLTP